MTQPGEKYCITSRIKNIRDIYEVINEFKKGYHPRTNLVKVQNVDLLAESHSISNIWKSYICWLLNVC
jgi:hypothetical protein